MGLDIYKMVSPGVYSPYREYNPGEIVDETRSPLITTLDGVLGGNAVFKLYVRNDDPTEYYTNISVIPFSHTSPSEVDGVSTGYGMKLKVSSIQPTEGEWEDTDYANQISITDIGSSSVGDTSSYKPFWCRIEVPAGASISNRENVTLRLYYKANPVV